MSNQHLRTSATLFCLSALLLSGFAAAQTVPDSTESVPAPAEPVAQAQPASPEPTPPVAAAPATASSGVSLETPPAPAPVAPPDEGPRTLISSKSPLGGYGGLDVAYTRLVGNDSALVCGSGAFLADHRFVLGLSGCGNATRISGQDYGDVVHEANDRLEFGYGGLLLGYQFFPKQIYNLALTAMVGAGASAIVNHNYRTPDGSWNEDDDNDGRVKEHDVMFVAEPRVTGYLNITRWARMGAFVGYRFVNGSEMKNVSNTDLDGPVVGGTVQFGWF